MVYPSMASFQVQGVRWSGRVDVHTMVYIPSTNTGCFLRQLFSGWRQAENNGSLANSKGVDRNNNKLKFMLSYQDYYCSRYAIIGECKERGAARDSALVTTREGSRMTFVIAILKTN